MTIHNSLGRCGTWSKIEALLFPLRDLLWRTSVFVYNEGEVGALVAVIHGALRSL